jgi:hypothetical protein
LLRSWIFSLLSQAFSAMDCCHFSVRSCRTINVKQQQQQQQQQGMSQLQQSNPKATTSTNASHLAHIEKDMDQPVICI